MMLPFLSLLAVSSVLSSPLDMTEQTSSESIISQIIVPFKNLHLMPPFFHRHYLTILDPFDTTNATMCWARRECSSIKAFFGFTSSCNWAACPASMPVKCGLGCSTSKANCEFDIFHEITSVVEVAFNIGQIILAAGSAGSTTLLASTYLKWAEEAVEYVAIEALGHIIAAKVGTEAASQIAKEIIDAANTGGLKNVTIDWTNADPTGVSAVIKSFWKPICH